MAYQLWAVLLFLFLGCLNSQAQDNTELNDFIYHYSREVSENLSMTTTPAGNIVVAGQRGNAVLVASFAPNGRRRWSKELEAGRDVRYGDVAVGPDDHIWVAYRTDYPMIITTLNTDGSLLWQQAYQQALEPARGTQQQVPVVPQSLVPRAGGMTVFGFGGYRQRKGPFSLRLSADGDFQSSRSYQDAAATLDGAATATAEGDLVMAYGRASSSSQRLLKVDQDGQIVYSKEIQASSFNTVANLAARPGGGYYALLTNSTGSEFVLVNISEQGELAWRTRKLLISGSGSTQAQGLAVAPDKGALITGRVNTGGTIPRNEPAVIKVAPDGAFSYIRYFRDTVTPNPLYANALDVVPASGRAGYYIAGQSSQSQNTGDLALMRTKGFDPAIQCIGDYDFNSSDRAAFTLSDQTVNRTTHAGYQINSLSDEKLNAVRMERSAQCVTCQKIREVDIGGDTTLCPGDSLTLRSSILDASYEWSIPAGDTAAITVAREGQYALEADGLCATTRDTMELQYFDEGKAQPTADTNELDPGETVRLSADPAAVTDPVWQVDSGTFLEGPTVQHTYEEFGRYQPVLRYEGPNACSFADTVDEIAVLTFDLYVPNAFTPDRDGVNEVFKPEGQGVRQYTLKVFNRWGERVFEGRNEGWDGKLNGELVQPGVYFYTLKVRNAFNNLEFREGRLTVVR